ncbi:MAG: type I glyceraldehyde-3-phosphate dehydrogenase [Acidobacteria bacterium]|nr:MAG: type I glyceraldehyde-3-phosphate dehydrogenase [Acidobacteriota bacterium]
MPLRVGINGFGRIGRNFFRAAIGNPKFEIVALNDITAPAMLVHLLKYDSILGNLDARVEAGDNWLAVNGRRVPISAEPDPAKLDWSAHQAALVAECSGKFSNAEGAGKHLRGSVKKVVISAPAKGADVTLVPGVNDAAYDPAKHRIISNASCTTNCLAPVAKVLHDAFHIVSGSMTTVHSYTNDQRLLDLPHKDKRRARAAAINLIPTSTGAASALHLVIPDLQGKLDGFSLRVPTPDVSVVDLTVWVERAVTVEEVNAAFRAAAAAGPMQGILGYEEEELVSSDFKGDPRSAIFDSKLTRVIRGNCVKVVAWYDNEWGYSCRLRDLIARIAEEF